VDALRPGAVGVEALPIGASPEELKALRPDAKAASAYLRKAFVHLRPKRPK